MKTIDYTSFTKVTPLNHVNTNTKSRIEFEICHNENDDRDFVVPNVQEIICQLAPPAENDRFIPRPPPLVALSQAIRTKHPEQITDSKLNNDLPSIKDLPNSPANYSFVFYGFTSPYVEKKRLIFLNLLFVYFTFRRQLEEAKRLTRRMGDCFSFETVDMTITHVILADDDPDLELTSDLFLALIYGWLVFI